MKVLFGLYNIIFMCLWSDIFSPPPPRPAHRSALLEQVICFMLGGGGGRDKVPQCGGFCCYLPRKLNYSRSCRKRGITAILNAHLRTLTLTHTIHPDTMDASHSRTLAPASGKITAWSQKYLH